MKGIVERLAEDGPKIDPDRFVDGCLQLLGHYELADETRQMLVRHAENSDGRTDSESFPDQVGEMLQMIVATKEYLYA